MKGEAKAAGIGVEGVYWLQKGELTPPEELEELLVPPLLEEELLLPTQSVHGAGGVAA